MRRFLLILLTGCGRLSFEIVPLPVDSVPEGDGSPGDGPTDGSPSDGPQVRACHTDVRYTTSQGLVNTYREGVSQVSWGQARLDCMTDGADLWVIDDVVEQSAFTGDWIGITDELTENVWRKVDGTVASFLPFLAGEPDGGTDENCLRNESNGFEDRECTDQRDYVCECPAP